MTERYTHTPEIDAADQALHVAVTAWDRACALNRDSPSWANRMGSELAWVEVTEAMAACSRARLNSAKAVGGDVTDFEGKARSDEQQARTARANYAHKLTRA